MLHQNSVCPQNPYICKEDITAVQNRQCWRKCHTIVYTSTAYIQFIMTR